MSNTERQRAYKVRQRTAGENDRRQGECYVSTAGFYALKWMAWYKGTSQGQIIKDLVERAERAVTRGMDDALFKAYLSDGGNSLDVTR